MKLIVGLGNPGQRYEDTRHNVGFRVVERIRDRLPARKTVWTSGSELVETRYRGQRLLLLKPGEYMNRSGGPTARAAALYRLPPEEILVVHDDLDLSPGRLRLRAGGGGSGGHRGIEDIAQVFSAKVCRLRIGIGRLTGVAAEKYVLQRFTSEEVEIMADALTRAVDAALCFVDEGIVRTMDRFNGEPRTDSTRDPIRKRGDGKTGSDEVDRSASEDSN